MIREIVPAGQIDLDKREQYEKSSNLIGEAKKILQSNSQCKELFDDNNPKFTKSGVFAGMVFLKDNKNEFQLRFERTSSGEVITMTTIEVTGKNLHEIEIVTLFMSDTSEGKNGSVVYSRRKFGNGEYEENYLDFKNPIREIKAVNTQLAVENAGKFLAKLPKYL